MKTTENNTLRVIKAMDDFRKSYHALLAEIDFYESETGNSINELAGFAESYPFDKSLDELPINEWYADVNERYNGIYFNVLDYEYLNTGGNAMVGIHEVYLPVENRTVYIYTNEEGATMSTVDYIRKEIPNYDYDKYQLENVDWNRITGFEKYFNLYRYCHNQYLKDDCRYFDTAYGVQYHLLSDELQKKVDADYLVWSESESDGLIRTNGVDIIEDEGYRAQFEEYTDERLQAIKDFKQWHWQLTAECTEDELQEIYDKGFYSIRFNGKRIRLPYDADTFNAIDDLLARVIEQW